MGGAAGQGQEQGQLGQCQGRSVAVPASPDCFSPATAQVALLKLQVDLMEGN